MGARTGAGTLGGAAARTIGWARANLATLFDNAQSVRDYRAQLRSSKTVWLWTLYVAMLIVIALVLYSNVVGQGVQSVSRIQGSLRQFYDSMATALGWLVVLMTPALTAFTIVQERERKSLDLVFSAPVRPKYLLVGKMLSSFRYTWMLLVLSLPVTAVSVVMGGATWVDVIGVYAILSGSALAITSIGLLISSLAGSVPAALILTYLAAGVYLLLLTAIAGMMSIPSMMTMTGSLEAPFLVAMSPFGAAGTSITQTVLWGLEIPNWILGFAGSLLVAKIFVLGAGSSLSPYGSPETKSLRIHGLVYAALIGIGVGYALPSSSMFVGGSATPPTALKEMAIILTWLLIPVGMFVPHLCCCSPTADRKYRDDGFFSLRAAFVGSPAGALPYLLMVVLSYYVGAALALGAKSSAAGGSFDWSIPGFGQSLGWFLALAFFAWGTARMVSSGARTLRAARILFLAVLMILFPIGLPTLAILDGLGRTSGFGPDFLMLHPMYPLLNAQMYTAESHAALMAVVGGAFAYVAWRRRREKDVS